MFLFVISLTIFACLSSSNTEAKVLKRVLIEENTGAWCGNCPRAMFEIEKLEIAHGNKVIPVAIHYGDPMETPFASEVPKKWGVDTIMGLPSVFMNRIQFDTTLHSIMVWDDKLEYYTNNLLLLDSSVVDLNILSWKIDKETKKLEAEIEATFVEDYTGQLAFNLYILEDGQTGTGSKWDQANYLSGAPAYIASRFYYLPLSIKGFKHDNVLLHMADGGFGSTEGLPAVYEKGQKYTKKYTVDLTKLAIPYQNLDNLWIAAMIMQHEDNKFEIMNSNSAGKIPHHNPKATDPLIYTNIEKATTISKTIEVENQYDKPLTVKMTLNTPASTIPEGWTLKIKEESKVIPAKSKQTYNIDITSSDKSSFARYVMLCQAEDGDKFKGGSTIVTVGALSKGADALIYKFGDSTIKSVLDVNPEFTSVVAIPFDSVSVRTLDFSSAKVVILSEPTDLAFSLSFPSSVIYIVEKLLDSKKPFLMTSESALYLFDGKEPDLDVNPELATLFKDRLKINSGKGKGLHNLVDDNYEIITGEIVLSANHGICKNLPNPIIINDTQDQEASIDNCFSLHFCPVASLDDKVAEIIMYAKVYGDTPNDTNGIAAAITLPESKALFYGFHPGAIADYPVRTVLVNNSIGWLFGKVSVEGLSNFNSANIKIAPNPSSNFAEISLNIKEGDFGKLYISDINGRVVSLISASDALQSNYKVDLNSFPSGNYYIVAEINGLSSATPLVIKK